MFDMKKLLNEVDEEVQEEILNAAKTELKSKKKEIARAKAIVANLERDMVALTLDISERVG